jgi:hypothetical protein
MVKWKRTTRSQIKIKKESERSSIWVLDVLVLPLYMTFYRSLEQKLSLIGVLYTVIEEFEDIKRVIRIRKSKKARQHNGQMKKDKRANKRSTKH